MDDLELEQAMREGLQHRAEQVDTSAPIVERARAASRRRRGGVVVGLAAASVIAVVAAGVAIGGRGGDEPHPGERVGEPQPLPEQWRTEYWHDMSVDVPADWGYGGAPMDDGTGEVVACWPSAMVGADGRRLEDDPTRPYVGRPIALTDVCTMYPFNAPGALPPKAPYVWLGGPDDFGRVDLGDGWVQETVEVNGSRLTVASDDPALRTRIIDSAGGGETCMSSVEPEQTADVFPRYEPGNTDDVARMVVCAYRLRHPEGSFPVADLSYVTSVGRRAAREYVAAVAAGEEPRDQCPTANYTEFEWVVLELEDGAGETIRRDVAHLACPGVDVGGSTLKEYETVRLTPEMVRPWAVDGIPATVSGPTGGKGAMIDSFIGPLG